MTMLLMGLSSIPSLLVGILIVCMALAVIYYLIKKFLDEPLRGYVFAVVLVIAVIILIVLLLPLTKGGPLG